MKKVLYFRRAIIILAMSQLSADRYDAEMLVGGAWLSGDERTEVEEMARLITAEQEKPLSKARSEVNRAVQTFRLSGAEAKRQFGESVSMDAQQGFDRSHAFTQREPLGVVVGGIVNLAKEMGRFGS